MIQAPRTLVRALLYPVHERLRGRSTVRHFRTMRRNDRLSASELQELHDRMLVAYLAHAAQTVPWYRDRVAADAIKAPCDIERFPLIDKPTIREAGDALKSESWTGRWLRLETGGSAGEPLRFWSDPDRESSQLACKLRSRAWWGLHPGHRETDLWGSPIETARNAGLRSVVADLMGFQLLPAFRLNDETMATFRDRIVGGRADFLYGYASALGRYARFLEERNEDLRPLGLRVAICTAETLLPQDREVIERRIAPVANEYGCRDGGLVAHEDPDGNLRLMHDAVHVEIIRDDGSLAEPGEEGEVVLTNLFARAYPMVRYRLGDRAALLEGPPPDGLPHPALAKVTGRTTDFLIAADGSQVHALGVIYVLREIPGVARFRVVQETRDHVAVLLVPGPELDRATAPAEIAQKTRAVLGETVDVEVGLVDDLEPLPSGKHRYIICNVDPA